MEAKREYMCRERIVDLEFKISRLGLLGKAYYDLVQIKLRRHRNQISTARTQNLLLHAALDTLRQKALIARKNLGDLESLRKTVASLRVTYDHQRKLVFSRQAKLEAQVTDTHSAELECAGVLDPNTPDLVRIRRLEAMLNAMRLKTKDVQILMRHYEATLKPMKDDYIACSAKLEAAQNILNMKRAECEKLINSHHDAIRARDASKKELEELIGTLFGKDGRNKIPLELQNKMLAAIKEIKQVMEVGSMREMYHQFILQEKQSAYLESIYTELKRTVDQLKNEYPPRRKTSLQPHAVHSVIEGTKNLVRRQSSRRGSLPLLQILDGTQKLVERLHDCHVTLALHRKMKFLNREAYRKAKEEAKSTGREYVRESRFAELEAEEESKKAAKEKLKADIARETAAREAAAKKKEEDYLKVREERRQEIREDMADFRREARMQSELQAEVFAKWDREHGTAKVSTRLTRGKSLEGAESMNTTQVAGVSQHTEIGLSEVEFAQEGPHIQQTTSIVVPTAQTHSRNQEHLSEDIPNPDRTEGAISHMTNTNEFGKTETNLTQTISKDKIILESSLSTEPEIHLRRPPSLFTQVMTLPSTSSTEPEFQLRMPQSSFAGEGTTLASSSLTTPEIQVTRPSSLRPHETPGERDPLLISKSTSRIVDGVSLPHSEEAILIPTLSRKSETQLEISPSLATHESPTEGTSSLVAMSPSPETHGEKIEISSQPTTTAEVQAGETTEVASIDKLLIAGASTSTQSQIELTEDLSLVHIQLQAGETTEVKSTDKLLIVGASTSTQPQIQRNEDESSVHPQVEIGTSETVSTVILNHGSTTSDTQPPQPTTRQSIRGETSLKESTEAEILFEPPTLLKEMDQVSGLFTPLSTTPQNQLPQAQDSQHQRIDTGSTQLSELTAEMSSSQPTEKEQALPATPPDKLDGETSTSQSTDTEQILLATPPAQLDVEKVSEDRKTVETTQVQTIIPPPPSATESESHSSIQPEE
ncbi:hypothetical protein R1sor_025023 [Riccia sorocarpa]|uniref:Uncharacterized protein n=1 Tax=Riccia sorocarpa TaxID=122646 RepID=A0ABD3G7D7_9MARC